MKTYTADETMNNPLVVDQHNLTVEATVEATNVEVDKTILPTYDPYPDKTPTSMITREYLLTSGTINTGTDEFFFPLQALLSNTTLSNYLKNFRFLRTGIRLRFLFVTNPMQYGLIGISRLPYIQPGETKWKYVEQQSQSNMMLVDINSQESAEITLPYLNPQNMIEWRNADDYPDWRIGMHAFVIDTLSAATSATVYYQVFANLVDPETSGLVQTSFGEFQSGRGVRTIMDMAFNIYNRVDGQRLYDTAMNVGGATATLAKGISAGATVTKVGQTIYDYATAPGDQPSEDKDSYAEDDYPETEQAPMRLTLAADLSCTSGSVSRHYAVLGDNKIKQVRYLPNLHTLFRIKQLCKVPVYYNTISLTNSTIGTPAVVDLLPFSKPSYFNYLSKMFRFWRGGFNFMCYFITASSASARVQVTLYPAQDGVTPDTKDVGDLPSTLVSVRGTEYASFHMPFLSTSPWLDTNTNLPQSIVFTLSESMPQPYDKAVNVYIVVFLQCGDDICFSSLCSARPGEGEFQSRSIYPAKYMGEIYDVRQILNRFSSRSPNLESTAFTNGPLQIDSYHTTVPSLSQLDNFDYVSNLYHFFTGSTCQKVFFDGTAVPGNIFVALENPRTSSYGSNTTCGNSVAITNQAVWPCIEYIVPYNVEFPYLDIFGELDNINTVYNYAADVTEYYISAGRDFQLMYTMPVPDFFFTSAFASTSRYIQANLSGKAEDRAYTVFKDKVSKRVLECPDNTPSVDVGEFQSYSVVPRWSGRNIWSGNLLLNYALGAPSYSFLPPFALDSASWCYRLQAAICSPTGTLKSGVFFILNGDDSDADDPYVDSPVDNGLYTIDVVTLPPDGSPVTSEGFVSKLFPYSSPGLVVRSYFTNSTLETDFGCSVCYKVQFYPFSDGVCPVSPGIQSDTVAATYTNYDTNVDVVTMPDVTISGAVDVLVANTPHVIVDDTVDVAFVSPPDVIVSNSSGSPVQVFVGNTNSQPVPVTASSDFPVAAQIMGVPGATVPVWVTNYPN